MPIEKHQGYIKKNYNSCNMQSGLQMPLCVEFHTCDIVEVQHNTNYPLHTQHCYELIIPVTGKYHCKINGIDYHIPSGEVLLIQPEDKHSDYYEAGNNILFILFHLKFPDGQIWPYNIFADNSPANSKQLKTDDNKELQALFNLFIQPVREENTELYNYFNGLISAIFWKLIDILPKENLSYHLKRSLSQDQIKRQLSIIFKEEIGNKLDLEYVANKLGLSRRSLFQKCKTCLGMTPLQAFTEFKIREAATLLQFSTKSIKEIADELGFANQFHFSRLFKQIIGISPSEYIKEKR